MDGVAAVEARIVEIRGRIASVTPAKVPLAAGARPAFAAVLAQAVTAGTAATPTGTGGAPGTLSTEDGLAALLLRQGALESSSMTADGVPHSLAAHGNGTVPATALSPIGHGGHRLWAPAAESFRAMTAAAAREGIDIGVTDSYRSFEAQVDLADRKGLYSQGGLAAAPGTSDHGWGRALDLDLDASAQAWMRRNAGQFGFVEDTPREPWHWVYSPTR